MYSVFVQILLTYQGKKIVCEYQGDKYAQKLYAKISAHSIKSTKTMINSPKLLTYITSDRFRDGSWRGTT